MINGLHLSDSIFASRYTYTKKKSKYIELDRRWKGHNIQK